MTFVLPELQARPGQWGPPADVADGQKAASIDRSTHKWSNLESQTGEWWNTVSINEKAVASYIEEAREADVPLYKSKGNYIKKQSDRHGANHHNNKKKFNRGQRIEIKALDDSFKLTESAERVTDFPLDALAKQSRSFDVPVTVTDLKMCGLPRLYNTDIENARLSAPKVLAANNEAVVPVPIAFDDSVMRGLLKSIDGTWPVVVATDDVLSSLMACTRSLYSWHVQCFRFKRFTFLNQVPHGRTDVEWVAETNTMTGPSEGDGLLENRISSLGKESTAASYRFRQQSLQKTTCKMTTEKRGAEFTGLKPMYRYRRYDIGEGASKYTLLVRAEVDAAVPMPGKPDDFTFLRIFGLLEHIPSQGTDKLWSNLESNPASILMNELKQNNFKMARWIAKSVLAGAHLMKIGFIARDTKSGTATHKIVRVLSQDPQVLGSQTGVTTAQLWSNSHSILSKLVSITNEMMGVTYDAKADVFSSTYSVPSCTMFLVKFNNESRVELIKQENDGHKDDADSSDSESESDSDSEDGDDESGSDSGSEASD